jgi:hypothetical protein
MASKTNRNPMLRSLATAEDYKGKTFKNKNLILFELWRDTNFGTAHGDMRNLVLYPASPQRITGAVAMLNCTFNAVDFFAVGFTGAKDFLDSLLEVETREEEV